jgi:hypothetical protein
MSLITACAISCSLKFHVVCTCTFFGDTICLLTNRKMIKIVSLIDLHIVLTCIYMTLTLLFSLQYLSESCFRNDNDFFITQPSSFFFIYQTFYSHKNIIFPILFSSVPPPAMKGRSLIIGKPIITNV